MTRLAGGAGGVGDELAVAAHAALRPAQVQESQVAQLGGHRQAGSGMVRLARPPSVDVAEPPQQVARLGLDLGQLRGVEGAPPGAHRRIVGALHGRQEAVARGRCRDAQEVEDALALVQRARAPATRSAARGIALRPAGSLRASPVSV